MLLAVGLGLGLD